MLVIKDLRITPQMLTQIAEIDEFKGAWTGFASLKPEQLKVLKRISTIESIGSSNRIEGNKLSDAEVEELLSHIDKKLSRNQKNILELFNNINELDSSEIADKLSMNKETVKKNVRALVYAGYLIKIGETKGTWYELKK